VLYSFFAIWLVVSRPEKKHTRREKKGVPMELMPRNPRRKKGYRVKTEAKTEPQEEKKVSQWSEGLS
jgi:hypothetical protein